MANDTTNDRSWFQRSAERYARVAADGPFPLDWNDLHPCDERAARAVADAHYIHADLWAAERVFATSAGLDDSRPHVDVGSRLDGLCTHVLGQTRWLVHVDVRPTPFQWPGFTFRQDDARTLATFADASVTSLSCLHAAEHVGLGRYGDEIDGDGMVKCMASLARVLASGGRLYFAVPVGWQRVIFNAHRIAAPSWVCETFAGFGLTLESFAAVDDAGRWHPEAKPSDFEGARYACGCFEWRKP